MSGESDDFRPRLGRINDRGRRPPTSVISHICAAAPGALRPPPPRRAARIEPLDARSLEKQVRAPGLTWLDRHLAGEDSAEVIAAGFGAEVRKAGRQRLAELEQRGLIGGMDQPLTPDAATIEKLRWAGIHHEGRAYAGETGRAYRPATPGRTLDGTLEKAIDTPSGRLAVISTGWAREFSLVPWQDEMKRHLHQGVAMEISRAMTPSRLRQRSLGIGM